MLLSFSYVCLYVEKEYGKVFQQTTIFLWWFWSEIYKGNSKKYKGKYGSEGFFIFYPLQYFYRWFGIVGCIPVVHTLLLTPVLSYIWLSHAICHIRHIWHIWHIWLKWRNDIHHMALWMSKEPLGPQECSPLSQITYLNIVKVWYHR